MRRQMRSSAISGDFTFLFNQDFYDEITGYGLLRHVLRVAVSQRRSDGSISAWLPILLSKNNFVKALRKLHPEIGQTVVLNVNDKDQYGFRRKETVIYGCAILRTP